MNKISIPIDITTHWTNVKPTFKTYVGQTSFATILAANKMPTLAQQMIAIWVFSSRKDRQASNKSFGLPINSDWSQINTKTIDRLHTCELGYGYLGRNKPFCLNIIDSIFLMKNFLSRFKEDFFLYKSFYYNP